MYLFRKYVHAVERSREGAAEGCERRESERKRDIEVERKRDSEKVKEVQYRRKLADRESVSNLVLCIIQSHIDTLWV